MKILAVRGRNIASLAGAFELDFDQGLLAHSGLFAITGPTGAGKSSLLDAICLPLFDKTPRLSVDSGSAAIGHDNVDDADRIRSNDVRGLLTRGTESGFAEVDFRGIDGQRYRARWEVQRARLKLTGRLQPQTLALENLDTGARLEEGKKTTLTRIKQALGLDFDQFHRSVMLAQGDFAAFLKAKAKDRGELLERMTGTDLYARLSVAAFNRAKDERIALAKLRERLENVRVLDDETRKALDQQVKELVEAEEKSATLRKELEGERAWYVQQEKLRQGVAASDQALREALEPWAAYEAPGWNPPNLDEPQAIKRFADDVRPRLTIATKMDALLGGAQEAVDGAASVKKAFDEERAKLEAKVKEAVTRVAATESQRAELVAWLGENAATELLAKNWGLYEEKLSALVKAEAKLAALGKREKALAKNQPAATLALENFETELASARAALKQAKETCDTAEDGQRKIPIDDLRTAREAGRVKCDLLGKLEGMIAEREETLASLAAHTKTRDAALTGAQVLGEACAVLDGKLQQAEEDLKRARATLDLSGHRDELVAGEPCPLCGATDHPYAINDPGAKRLFDELEASIQALKSARNDKINALARESATAKSAGDAITTAQGVLHAIGQRAEQNRAAWMAHANGSVIALPAVDEEGAQQTAGALVGGLATNNQKLDESIGQYELLSKQVCAARAAKDACQIKVDDADKEAERARRRVAELQVEAASVATEREHATQIQTSSLDALGQVFDGDAWRMEFLVAPAAYVATCKTRVEVWNGKRTTLEGCNKRLPAEVVDRDAKNANLAKLAGDCDAAARELASRSAKLVEQQNARKTLFAGHATDEVERALVVIEKLDTQRAERRKALTDHEQESKPKRSAAALVPELEALLATAKQAREQLDKARGMQSIDDEARKQRDVLGPEIEEQRARTERWSNLEQLIGSASGAKFRDFAQGLTLRMVLEYANQQLQELRPRYTLMAIPDQNLEMQIVDHDMGDEARPVSSLSGGETFLVSLALALGLAASGGGVAEVESLFIDEGFGALDEGTVGVAIATLDALQASGRTIGVVSHIDSLPDRLGVYVKVTPQGGGRSKVEVIGA